MKITIYGLRILLNNIELLDTEVPSLKNYISENLEKLQSVNLEVPSWAETYEIEFEIFLANFLVSLELHHELKEYKDLELEAGLTKLMDRMIHMFDDELESMSTDEAKTFTMWAMSLTYVMFSSLKSLMIYGHYINELIQIARTYKNTAKGDNALLKAVRIDPCVINCPTASSRLSYAVLFGDHKFLKKLRNALSGKLGTREAKQYQKMRFVLQVLHEAGAANMTDHELNDLFVKELKLYSDSQGTSEKNIKEFAYNFKKQKSTIQKDKK